MSLAAWERTRLARFRSAAGFCNITSRSLIALQRPAGSLASHAPSSTFGCAATGNSAMSGYGIVRRGRASALSGLHRILRRWSSSCVGSAATAPCASASTSTLLPGLSVASDHSPYSQRASHAEGVLETLSTAAAASAGAPDPGQSVQVDVKHIRMGSGRFYQFTALDEATRYRVLQIYDHNSVRSALDFVKEIQERLPAVIQRIRTDNDSSFEAEFTWHLHDLGIEHRRNPPGCLQANGKVERSHRTDEDEFYRRFTFSSAQDLQRLLREWEREYNHGRPHPGTPR